MGYPIFSTSALAVAMRRSRGVEQARLDFFSRENLASLQILRITNGELIKTSKQVNTVQNIGFLKSS